MDPTTLPSWNLPAGVTSRFVDTSPVGLKFHILESIPDRETSLGSKDGQPPPLILLLHGFPNLSYDWRFVLPKLAEAGYYAVAFDLRGFGRSHNADLSPIAEETFRPLTAIRDIVALVYALGYTHIHTLVGQDLGAYIAAITALMRSDMIRSLLLMAHTWKGAPTIPFGTSSAESLVKTIIYPEIPRWEQNRDVNIHASLAKLEPPRKHYKWYNASSQASDEWTYPIGEPLRQFLRGYFHLKSGNHIQKISPRPLKSWTAEELAILPHYYVMRADKTMRENIDLDMAEEPSDIVARLNLTPWLSDADLDVYEQEYARTSFKGPLLWYRVLTDPELSRDLVCFAGSKLKIPTKYVSGLKDWGTFQIPGGLEAMQQGVSVEQEYWKGATLVPGAGHWINMEKPEESAAEILTLASSVS